MGSGEWGVGRKRVGVAQSIGHIYCIFVAYSRNHFKVSLSRLAKKSIRSSYNFHRNTSTVLNYFLIVPLEVL